jgi:3-hydroxyacyl-CoA dehydrogenase
MNDKVGVIGAGIMGHGIAEVIAISGYEVTILDTDEKALKKAVEKIQWSLEHLKNSTQIKENVENIISRIKTTTNYKTLSGSAFIIETVNEDTKIKKLVYGNLSKVLGKDAIVASNTSTIPITELGSMYGQDSNFVGIHFSNPPVLMPLVEIIKGDKTTDSVLRRAEDFVSSLGKQIIVVKKDIPGFLINRLNDRIIMETMTILEEGTLPEVIDAMTKFRLRFPMGMCELLDFVGIDTVYNANSEMVNRGFNSKESRLLAQKVKSGKIGVKSGEGFYKYQKNEEYSRPVIVPVDSMYNIDPLRILAPAINEASWLLRNEVCSREDIEKAMKIAMNWPHGLLEYADRFGIDNVLKILEDRNESTGESQYVPDPFLIKMADEGKIGQRSGEGFMVWEHDSRAFGSVDYSLVNDYALLELNRPDKLNSLNEDIWEGLRKALIYAEDDSRVRSVVVTGKGKAFCAGDDIAMMDLWKTKEDAEAWMNTYAEPLIKTIQNYSKPLLSAINGIAFGGGCELNVLFDVVLADENAIFAIPEGLIGALPPIATSYGFALVNKKFARYALTGEWFTAVQAKELNLVDVVVPHGELNSAISEFTEKISRIAPLATASIKKVVNGIKDMYRLQASGATRELVKLSSTVDFKNGQKGFLEKKLPKWEGR